MSDETDDLVAAERRKYEQMWEFPQYRNNFNNRRTAARFITLVDMPAGSSVIDVGCGPGYASRYFHERGMKVYAADIASNALAPENVPIVEEFFLGPAWDIPSHIKVDFGFCTDVMEHIPTEKVSDTLAALKNCTRRHVFFDISLRKDGMGKLIGDVLHLTVRSQEWWESELQKHWKHVFVERINEKSKDSTFVASDEPIVGVKTEIRT